MSGPLPRMAALAIGLFWTPSYSAAGELPAAALCISGQARTLPDVAWTIRRRLLEPWAPFGGAATFLFVTRASYYEHKVAPWGGMRWTVPERHMARARAALAPVLAYVEYDERAAAIEMPPRASRCYKHAESGYQHWSWQSVQFWAVARCFDESNAFAR